jgi:hypothetical protein
MTFQKIRQLRIAWATKWRGSNDMPKDHSRTHFDHEDHTDYPGTWYAFVVQLGSARGGVLRKALYSLGLLGW